MKEVKYFIDSDSVIDVNFLQAFSYFEEAEKMIFDSQFNLYDEQEDLDKVKMLKRYNEKNRRLTQLGQACEYFLKTILLIEKMENNLDLSLEQLWDKKMMGHKIEFLFGKIDDLTDDFKNLFQYPNGNLGVSLNEEDLFQIINNNLDINENNRYSMMRETNYNLMEVLKLTRQIAIVTMMYYDEYKKTNRKIQDDGYQISQMIASELEFELSFMGFDKEQKERILRYIKRWSKESDKSSANLNHLAFMSRYKYLLIRVALSQNEIKSILSVPSAIFYNPDNYINKINYLLINDLKVIIKKYPQIIFYCNLESLEEKVKYFTDNKLLFVIKQFPQILSYSVSYVDTKIKYLGDRNLGNLLKDFPQVLEMSDEYIDNKYDYFVSNGLEFILAKMPQFFMITLSYLKTLMYYIEKFGIVIDDSNYYILVSGKVNFCKMLGIDSDEFMETFKSFGDNRQMVHRRR